MEKTSLFCKSLKISWPLVVFFWASQIHAESLYPGIFLIDDFQTQPSWSDDADLTLNSNNLELVGDKTASQTPTGFNALLRMDHRQLAHAGKMMTNTDPSLASQTGFGISFNLVHVKAYNSVELLKSAADAYDSFIYPSHFQTAINSNSNSAGNITPVPLPAALVLFGSALTGLVSFSRWKHRLGWKDPNKPTTVLGIKFPNLDYQQAMTLFQEWITSRVAHQVCFANVHTLVSCIQDKQLHNINQQSFNAMDGLPLVWYAKLVHGKSKASRLCGPDLMLKCLDEGRERAWTHFFLGGTEPVLQDLVNNMHTRYPGVNIVGWHSPPFRALSASEDTRLIQLINDAKPDFLWVGLGAPKQEKWIAAHMHQLNVPVQLGVGAAFNFHSGHVKRAPLWMQQYGLEWLYRASTEKRLIKRYLTTNPIFLLLFVRDLFLIRCLRLKAV